MSVLDWLILAVVGALVVLAFRTARSKKGCSCGCGGACCGSCAACKTPLMFGVLVQAAGGHHVPLMVFTFVAFLQCVVAVIVGKPSKM